MRRFFAGLSLLAGIGAVAVALGALGLWAAGDPPPLGDTLRLIAGLIMVWFLARGLPWR
ncbi:MAG: hypothetical protein RMK64_13295 [Rhodovarius sp.]|nr:hypothetical protein [Rhodovarius sp.]MCX7932681.1 hypothetical protein [Rhodovarius sp.]MDW8315940.1 hypothetical protein [Rhodovarius sp.]